MKRYFPLLAFLNEGAPSFENGYGNQGQCRKGARAANWKQAAKPCANGQAKLKVGA